MTTGEGRNEHSVGGDKRKHFRVFLASPGDVPLERKLARESIIHLNSERRFRSRINIEIIAWDQPGAKVAMEAGLTPQEAIAQGLPKPDECDLAVIILWSRIGTQLPADFELKEDGSPYLSGTEWEYLNALQGYKRSGKPAVWIYRCSRAPSPALNDPNYTSIIEQWNKLQQFFTSFTNIDGSLAGGINQYATPNDFREQFEHHLRDRLDKLLEALPSVETPINETVANFIPRWTNSPYLGLEAFTPEQAPIFFGRGAEVDQLLQQFSSSQVHFVAVVGVSGSGKSSLVMAGLLPRLRAGIIGNAPWVDLIFKPGERGGNPFLALAFSIKSKLEISNLTEQEIARGLKADKNAAQKYLNELLSQHRHAKDLLLVVDQFEELFTQSSAENRKDFLKLLTDIVAQPSLRVIVTMRADFYVRAIAEPALTKLLRRDRGTFPLDPPGMGAIHQMITRPAEEAALELQEGLAQRLLDDAGEGPGAMALIAFTLNQLYQREQHATHLSIQAYESFGGVRGAVQKRAEAAIKGLPVNINKALPKLFANLVGVNEQEIASRRRAPKLQLPNDAKIVADALIEARLVVTGEGEDKQPTLEVAHETVLTGWGRLRQWILEHAQALRARRDLERVAKEWDKADRYSGVLRTGILFQRYLRAAKPRSAIANDYLAACKRRLNSLRIFYTLAGLLVVAAFGILLQISKSDYPPALSVKALFTQIGIWPVSQPKMVRIPAGEFEMGYQNDDGYANERPVHAVRFDKAFEMGQFEVTFEEYDLFAAATERDKPSDEGWGRGLLPVINVTWRDAVAYTQWLSLHTGQHYRLPSEAEWEYATRAKTKTAKFWPETEIGKEDVACNYANVFDVKSETQLINIYNIRWSPFPCADGFPFTAPVGQFRANDWQLHDMLGNVWEWIQDCYKNNYEGASPHGLPWEFPGSGGCSRRVLRGGSWYDGPLDVRSAYRLRYAPDGRNIYIGFRLARTL